MARAASLVLCLSAASGCAHPGLKLTLLDAGDSTFQYRLRYHFKPGAEVTAIAGWKLGVASVTRGADGRRVIPRQALPGVRWDAVVHVDRVLGDGSAVLTREHERPVLELFFGSGGSADFGDDLRAALARFDRQAPTIRLESTGVPEPAKKADPEDARRLGAPIPFDETGWDEPVIPPPLPAQLVGVGARWETSRRIQRFGVYLDEHVVYQLVEYESGHGRIKAQATYAAEPQWMDWPGRSAHLESLSGIGRAEYRFDLDEPTARAAHEAFNVQMRVSFAGESWLRGVDLTLDGEGSSGLPARDRLTSR